MAATARFKVDLMTEGLNYGRFRGTERPRQVKPLWLASTAKSQKDGTHRTIYWVGRNAPAEDGTLVDNFKTAQSYQGDWENNQKHGYGVQTYADGRKYEGEWSRGKRSGDGVLWIPAGKNKLRKFYTGGWLNDKRHGRGTCFYGKGEVYQGDWDGDKRHGHGQMKYESGDLYLGEWANDLRNGQGTLTKANGDSYEGGWLVDNREGSGSYFYAATGKVFVGEWVDDMPKAGVYSQAQSNPGHATKVPVTTTVPRTRLVDPSGVLESALQEVRTNRTGFRAKNTPLDALFAGHELNDLADAFSVAGKTKLSVLDARGVFLSLGIQLGEEELRDLLHQVGWSVENDEGLVDFENFVRCVALILDYEVTEPNFVEADNDAMEVAVSEPREDQ